MRWYSASTRRRISSFCAARSTNLIAIGNAPCGFGGQRMDPGGIANHHRARRHVAGNHRAGADQGALTDADPAHDDRAAANRTAPPDQGLLHQPLCVAFGRTVAVGRLRLPVLDEDPATAAEDLVP